jgi:endonuclease/exonuclease/phosphatase family metal-dependent hydrolase
MLRRGDVVSDEVSDLNPLRTGTESVIVATANVGVWAFGEPRPIAVVLQRADVILLQEALRGPNEDQFLIMADELKKLWGSEPHITFTNTAARGLIVPEADFGNGIISRVALDTNHQQFSLMTSGLLPNASNLQDRVVMHVSIPVGGRTVLLFNTHLPPNACMCRDSSASLNCEPGNREQMLDFIARQVAGGPRPAIVGGDLNVTRPSRALRFIHDVNLVDSWESFAGDVFNLAEVTKTVDYIFLSASTCLTTGAR